MMDLEARHTEFFLGIVGIIGGEFPDAGKSAMSGDGQAVLTKHFHHLFSEPDSEFLTDIDKGNRIEVFLHLDMAIGMDLNFYSVPFVYVGQKLRVRLTEKMVEVFSEDSLPVAAHSRLTGIGKFSTYDSHYPEKKLSVARFEVHHATEQATQLGPHVEKLVDKLLSTDYPLRHLRRVQGILRLAKRYPITPEALDHACQRALSFNKTRLAYIKDCALYRSEEHTSELQSRE